MRAAGDLRENQLTTPQFKGASIGKEERGDGGYTILPKFVCGVLVNTRSENGAVRAIGKGDDENVETGPSRKSEYWIISIKEGQSGAILGKSSYRLISR